MEDKRALGTVETAGEIDWILTGRWVLPSLNGLMVVRTWTPIPKGETPAGLGRTYKAAFTEYTLEPLPPKEHLEQID
jgi:hypothetical protein